jgi:hypothetical protein
MNIRAAAMSAAMSCTLIAASTLSAQSTEPQATPRKPARWELLVPSGAIVPTGVQRDAVKRGALTAVQLTYVARPAFAVTSTLGWARSRDIATAGSPKVDMFTYDVGAEVRAPRWLDGKAVTFSPFAGVGAGGRSYNYRKLEVDATHNVGAYASAGGELGFRRVRVRLEARDYVTGFKPLAGEGAARTGNDVVLMAGLRFASR